MPASPPELPYENAISYIFNEVFAAEYHSVMHSAKPRGGYFTKVLILFLAGILAHSLAGGSVIDFNRFMILTALISSCLFLTRNLILEGPELALLVLALQSAGHFLLGGADRSNDLQMTLAHLFAGLLSYKAVTHFDRFWEFIRDLFQALQIPTFEILAFQKEALCLRWNARAKSIAKVFLLSFQFRGPPARELL